MKSMSDGSTNNSSNGNNNNNHNWLGFSLSPQMKMEVASAKYSTQAPPASTAVPSSFYLTPPHLHNNTPYCYGVAENGGFLSPLTVMPLKSDGSLCIMEALSRSHTEGMVASSSPKLEDFLGGASATMAAHEYGSSHERETMALTLENNNHSSMYYHHQHTDQETKWMYSDHQELPCQIMYQTSPDDKETHVQDCDTHIPVAKQNWVSLYSSGPYSLDHVIDDGSGGSMGELQSLSLSMSPSSQSSSCVTASRQISPTTGTGTGTDCLVMETKKRNSGKVVQKQPVHRKSLDTFGQRTSQFRGVTRHRWTGRYEAHLWDNSCKKEGQTRKGRQVYLGGYDMEDKAARAYDLAALKYWGPSTHINFPLENYQQELEDMKNMSRQEFVAHLRRKSSGFSRGASIYRGVTRHHQHGRWQARIGRVAGNKDLYLGTFGTQEEAAEAYDVAAIKFRGVNAVTNFDITRYNVEKIMASNTLLAGELARRNKDRETNTTQAIIQYNQEQQQAQLQSSNIGGINGSDNWKMVNLHQPSDHHQQSACVVESLNYEKTKTSFSVNLQDLIGVDHHHHHQLIDDSLEKIGTGTHLSNSNPSSPVTSLSCSREGSPVDKNIKTAAVAANVNSWISMTHLPVFAAWSDA